MAIIKLINKAEFMTAYVLARAGAISGTVTGTKLVRSAAIVWQELQYETGAEVRPEPVAIDETGSNIVDFDRQTGEVFGG